MDFHWLKALWLKEPLGLSAVVVSLCNFSFTVIFKIVELTRDWLKDRSSSAQLVVEIDADITTMTVVAPVPMTLKKTVSKFDIVIKNIGEKAIRIEGVGFYEKKKASYTDEESSKLGLEFPLILEPYKHFRFAIPKYFYPLLKDENKDFAARDCHNNLWKLSKPEKKIAQSAIG